MSGVGAGSLRHQVVIQKPKVTQNPQTGGMGKTWEPVATVWADVTPMSAREFIAASAEQSEVRGRMTIRYRDDVDATMRVVHRGRYYAILGVLPDAESGREHLTLMTAEGVRLTQ